MIDAQHNIKRSAGDLIQSLELIRNAYAKALLIDQKPIEDRGQQMEKRCGSAGQEILQNAYRTDVSTVAAKKLDVRVVMHCPP